MWACNPKTKMFPSVFSLSVTVLFLLSMWSKDLYNIFNRKIYQKKGSSIYTFDNKARAGTDVIPDWALKVHEALSNFSSRVRWVNCCLAQYELRVGSSIKNWANTLFSIICIPNGDVNTAANPNCFSALHEIILSSMIWDYAERLSAVFCRLLPKRF